MLSSLYYGGFIEDEVKTHILDRSKKVNRIGADALYELEVYHLKGFKLKDKNVAWKVNVSERILANASYSTDLFQLAFFGNKGFEGTTAQLDPISLNVMRLQQAGLSWVHKEKMHSVGLAIVNAASGFFLESDSATLATATQGFSLNLRAAGSAIDAFNTNYFGSQGIGMALNFSLNEILSIGESTNISISGRDLGFARWSSKKVHLVDTSIAFSGLDVANLLSYTFPDTINILDSLLPQVTDTNFIQALPGVVQLVVHTKISDKMSAHLIADYIFNANYFPRFTLGSTYKFTDEYSGSVYASYGGYGNLRVGLTAQALWQKSIYLKVTAPNMLGFVSGKSAGMGLQFQLAKLF